MSATSGRGSTWLACAVAAAFLVGCGADDSATNATADSDPAATTTDADDTTTTSTSSSTTMAPAAGETWAFELTSPSGWMYDVTVAMDVEHEFGKYVTESPPGQARLRATVRGGMTWTFEPATPDRVPPEISVTTLQLRDAIFEVGAADDLTLDRLVNGAEACRGSTTEFECRLREGSQSDLPDEILESKDHEEATIDAAVAGLTGATPARYAVEVKVVGDGGCMITLLPGGAAELRTPGNECSLRVT